MSNRLGESIKKYRMQKNMSVRKLASLMFISPATVSRWETGAREPSLDALYKISEILEVKPSLLLAESSVEEPSHNLNVIFVEDIQIVLDGIIKEAQALIPATSIHGFTRAEDALIYAELGPVDLAFIDIQLRGESGIELARRLQSIHRKTNIIFLSDYPEFMLEAWQLHASGYLLKPLDLNKLRHELSNLRFPVSGFKLS
jgi:transcriptional regulator with XRE-family HTH domain